MLPQALRPELAAGLDLDTYLRDRYAAAVAAVPAATGEETPAERRTRISRYLHLSHHLRVLLERKDRLSMATGLEVRVPYTDHRLVEFALSVPWARHCADGREKSLLRAAFADRLPAAITGRVKSAYPVLRGPEDFDGVRAEAAVLLEEPGHAVFDLVRRTLAASAGPPVRIGGHPADPAGTSHRRMGAEHGGLDGAAETGAAAVTAKRRPDLDGATAALVFKFGRSRLHHGSLAVIRSLGRAGVPVYAVLSDEQVPARHSRYLRGGFVWPAAVHADGYRSGAAKPLLGGLARIIEIIDRPAVLIATDDQAATFLAERRAVLPSGCLVPGVPDDLPGKLIDKRTCTELIRAAGLPVPPQRVRSGPLVPGPDLDGLQLPLVLKRTLRTLRPDGSRTWSTLLVTSRAQLQAVLTDDTDGPFDVLAQALVPGQDWLYHGYRCVAAADRLLHRPQTAIATGRRGRDRLRRGRNAFPGTGGSGDPAGVDRLRGSGEHGPAARPGQRPGVRPRRESPDRGVFPDVRHDRRGGRRTGDAPGSHRAAGPGPPAARRRPLSGRELRLGRPPRVRTAASGVAAAGDAGRRTGLDGRRRPASGSGTAGRSPGPCTARRTRTKALGSFPADTLDSPRKSGARKVRVRCPSRRGMA